MASASGERFGGEVVRGGERIVEVGFGIEPDGGGVVAGQAFAEFRGGPGDDGDGEQGDDPPLHVARAEG